MYFGSVVFVFFFVFPVVTVCSRTDLSDCVCKWCTEMSSVGKVWNDTCFYISANDLIYYNNHMIRQFKSSDVPKSSIADGMIAQLTTEFYNRFRYNRINMNYTTSALFNYPQVERYTCPVLDISEYTIYNSERQNCQPFPSILLTKRYTLKEMKLYPLDHDIPCPGRQDSITIDEDKCLYFVDDTQQCEVARVTSPIEYEIFERFVLNMSITKTSNVCTNAASYGDCMLSLYNIAYNMFIVYLNGAVLDQLRSTPAFLVIGHETGFYHVDVMRRKMEYAETYTEAVSKLDKDLVLKHLCEGSPMRMTTQRVQLTPIARRTVATTVQTMTERPVVNATTNGPTADQNATTKVIFILTGVLIIFAILGLIMFQFRNDLMACCTHVSMYNEQE